MLIIRRRTILLVIFVLLFMISAIMVYNERRTRIKIGDRYIHLNTQVKLDPKKQYLLELWDYDWSLALKEQNYQHYLEGLITEFQGHYPNIKVELKLLNPITDHNLLEEALKRNEAPDVYCSAFTNPPFDYRYQIPVGPYLTTEELKLYHPKLLQSLTVDEIVVGFPRWILVNYWLGNRKLLEAAGISVEKIQNEGWEWEDFLKINAKLGSENYLFGGYLGSRGLLNYVLTEMNAQQTGVFEEPTKSQFARGYNNSDFIRTAGGELVEEQVDILVARLEQLKTTKFSKHYDSNMLGDFLTGKTVVLAGIRPFLYNFIKQELSNRNQNWSPVLLPAPKIVNDREIQLIENGVVCVYRNRKTKGDDHLLAAVKLGQFISSYRNNSLIEQLSFIPAIEMIDEAGEVNSDLKNMRQLLNRSTLIQLESGTHQNSMSEAIRKYMHGKITKEELKVALLNL